MTERWLPVVGWEGYYEVSDLGRIRGVARLAPVSGGGVRRVAPIVRKPSIGTDDVRVVILSRPGFRKQIKVGVTVLEAFVGPRPPGLWCCHYDDDQANNTLGNLRWDTPRANQLDRVRNGNHEWANAVKCIRGHAFDGLYTYPNGKRQRTCSKCYPIRRDRKKAA